MRSYRAADKNSVHAKTIKRARPQVKATPNKECARDGCDRWARQDDYCSSFCAKVANGVISTADWKSKSAYASQKMRNRNKGSVEVENTDAMNRAITSGFETNRSKH